MTTTSLGDFWAITTYFNPASYRRRRSNYRLFRDHLKLPLLTVELAFGQEFELDDNDADILVRLRGGDVMWQKERLLNLALRALPADCRKVAWLDCDIVFENEDWIARTTELLDRHMLVQPFSRVYWTPPGWLPGHAPSPATEVPQSTASLVAAGVPISECFSVQPQPIGSSSGFAWAASRDLLDEFGFYDACIIGGGDNALVRAAYGQPDSAVRLHVMDARRRLHYMAWATPFYRAVCRDVTYVESAICHLWHGAWENRRYRERYEDFAAFQFDPDVDIAVEGTGVWRWSSKKPAMHEYVRAYFAGRQEDEPT